MALQGFQERKMLRKVIFSVPVVLILWGVIFWMLWSAIVLWNAKNKVSKNNDEIKKEIANVEESRKTIEQKTESLKSEYGIDMEARSKFNLTKPGEKIVVFADEQNNGVVENKNKGLFSSIKNLLIDLFSFEKNEPR